MSEKYTPPIPESWKDRLFKARDQVLKVVYHPTVIKVSRFATDVLEATYVVDPKNPLSVGSAAMALIDSAVTAFELPQPTKLDHFTESHNLVQYNGSLSRVMVEANLHSSYPTKIVIKLDNNMVVKELALDATNKIFYIENIDASTAFADPVDRIYFLYYTTIDFDFEKLFDAIWNRYSGGIFLSKTASNNPQGGIRLNNLASKDYMYIGDLDVDAFAADIKVCRAEALSRSFMLVGAPGCGKAQPLDAKILTPAGWTILKDLKVGDLVVNPDGGNATITHTFDFDNKPIFEVEFSDGSRTRCCDEHLWSVCDKKYNSNNFKTISLSEIIKNGLTFYNGRKRYSVPLISGDHGDNSTMGIHPYILGAIIGDGGVKNVLTPTFHSGDQFIIDKINNKLPSSYVLKKQSKYGYRFIEQNSDGNTLWHNKIEHKITAAIKKLDLWGRGSAEKFLPEIVFTLGKHQRCELLQGLMDTDGSVSKNGHITYTSISHRLAKDVQKLVWSIGGTANISAKYKRCYNAKNYYVVKSYDVNIAVSNPEVIISLPRKLCRCKKRSKYFPTRYITNIRVMDHAPARCLKLNSKNELYITDDYIITHNTSFSINVAQKISNRILKIDPTATRLIGSTELDFIIKNLRPDIIIFDDFDRAALAHDSEHLLFLLENMKSQNPKLVIFATVNEFYRLDKALVRPGRFDEIIWFDEPSLDAKKRVVIAYLEKYEIKYDHLLIQDIVNKTKGMSPVYIKELCLRMRRKGVGCVDAVVAEFRRSIQDDNDSCDTEFVEDASEDVNDDEMDLCIEEQEDAVAQEFLSSGETKFGKILKRRRGKKHEIKPMRSIPRR